MTTIIDVAKKANVSKSTVSRVVSNKGYVSETSRQKVLAAMEELAYVPNSIARNLQSGETKTIGFIVPHFIDPLSVFLEAFLSIARQHGYYVTIFFTDSDQQKEIDAFNQLKYKQIDALFILTKANEWNVITTYAKYGPIATWQRIDSPVIYSAYVDHYQGYFDSLLYLYEKGYDQIGHVLGNQKNLNTKARLKAIKDFETQCTLHTPAEFYFYNSPHANGRTIAHQWHALPNKPNAMAIYSDAVAAQFISELENLGYQIPDDVAVIGFDNSEISKLIHLTTVDYSLHYQAENAFIYLYNQLNQQQVPFHPLPITLIERKTVPKRKR